MKKEFKINYRWQTCSLISHYTNQTINISERTYDKLCDIIRTELILNKDMDIYKRLYLKQPFKKEGNFVFINNTQRDFINKYLKLKLKDRNTCLFII